MAYSNSTLQQVSQGIGAGGINIWSYSTADSLATVAGAGYFSDGVSFGMKVGDVVLLTVSNILKAGTITAVNTSTKAATFTVGAIT